MKKKNKIGILTTIAIGLSNIVYGKDIVFQTKYGIPNDTIALYGIPADPSNSQRIIEETENVWQIIGKIAIIPIILLIGVFVIIKISKKKKIEKKDPKEE